MSDHSPRLDLPYVQPAQAQKHVTVNEAFERLDALTQLVVQSIDAQTPPPAPDAGKAWGLGASPTGTWAGQGGHLAVSTHGGGWLFILPSEGWRAWSLSDGAQYVFRAGQWQNAAPERVAKLGVGTNADDTNKLSVVGPATLLSHTGSGHQVKINKAGPSDTASVLFQSNWAGHAEMGLTGNNEFSVKVSPDGGSWVSALRVVSDGTLRGNAVQGAPLDDTAGRLVTTGGFGLGHAAALPNGNIDQATLGGTYGGFGGTHANASAGDNPFTTSAAPFVLQVMRGQQVDEWTQIAIDTESGAMKLRHRKGTSATASAWTEVVTQARADRPIADGGIIESGSGANGSYVRYADGTQVCRMKRIALPYRSAGDCFAQWSFPQAFVDTDITIQASLTVASDGDDPSAIGALATPSREQLGQAGHGALSTASAALSVARVAGAPDFVAGDQVHVAVIAHGRWR